MFLCGIRVEIKNCITKKLWYKNLWFNILEPTKAQTTKVKSFLKAWFFCNSWLFYFAKVKCTEPNLPEFEYGVNLAVVIAMVSYT